jgi:hypothetical protein
VSFQLDFGYGTTGTIINSANSGFTAAMPGTVGVNAAPFTGSFIVQQAYGTIALPGNLTLDFGKFVTTAGAEVIEANKNWLYSRSLLFFSIPLLHTGARANLKVSDQLTLQASLVNGWNNDPDNNAYKTIGVSAAFTASPMVSVIGTGYFGKEATQPVPGGATPGDWTILIDLVGAFTISDKLGLNVNFDYINAPIAAPSSSNHQLGVSGMARYVFNDHVNLAGRFEWLQSKADTAYGSVTLNQEELTVDLGLDVGKNFELRPEFRGDFSGDEIFPGMKKNQFTGTLAALTWF